MDMRNVNKMKQAIDQIENWKGQAYIGPCEECPEGDEVYKALEELKEIVSVEQAIESSDDKMTIVLQVNKANFKSEADRVYEDEEYDHDTLKKEVQEYLESDVTISDTIECIWNG